MFYEALIWGKISSDLTLGSIKFSKKLFFTKGMRKKGLGTEDIGFSLSISKRIE
jgi:hypothetical protein